MKEKLEITVIKANSTDMEGKELYWIFSRSQLEFLFKEVEVYSSPPFVDTVKYQEVMLPLVRLEKYYGLEESDTGRSPRYLVVRSVNEQKELVKLIVESSQQLRIQPLQKGLGALPSAALPENSRDILGAYPLGRDKVGVVPDFVRITSSLQVRGN